MRLTLGIGLALLLSLAGNGWQLYRAGGAEPKCEVKLAAQVNGEAAAAQTDQHAADQKQIADLKAAVAKMQADSTSDAGEIAGLTTRTHAQEKVIHDLQAKHDADALCLDAPVPAALFDSLHTGATGAAEPRGPSH